MNFFFNLFPGLPWDIMVVTMNAIAFIGVILHIYGVFLEKERNRDMVFVIGGTCLFIYSLWIKNTFFSVAMGGFALASLVEFIEIITGYHKHTKKLVEEYKHPNQ